MVIIDINMIGAVLAFAVGAVIAFVSFLFSQYVLKRHTEKYVASQILRQVLQAGYLVALYALSVYTPCDGTYLLVGGALGLTLPMIWFTYRLVKLNSKGKEDPTDG